MSQDDDLLMLAKFGKRSTSTAAGRRERETRIISYSDRRRARATGRTEQLNMRVRPEFKARLISLAEDAGLLMVEYVEQAVEMKARHEGHS